MEWKETCFREQWLLLNEKKQEYCTLSKWLNDALKSFICSWVIPFASLVRIWVSTSLIVRAMVVSRSSHPTRMCYNRENTGLLKNKIYFCNAMKSTVSKTKQNKKNSSKYFCDIFSIPLTVHYDQGPLKIKMAFRKILLKVWLFWTTRLGLTLLFSIIWVSQR